VSRTPRCLLPDLAHLAEGDRARLEREQRHHFGRVLRLRDDAPVELVDGAGGLVRGRWCAGGEVLVTEVCPSAPPPRAGLHLAVAPPRPSRLDWLVEKAAELGVSRLTLLDTRHAAREVGPGRLERLQRKAGEALQQSRHLHALRLDGPLGLSELLAARGEASLWVCHPPADGCASTPPPAPPADAPLLALVGPEGGLSDAELEQLDAAGAARVALGAGVLRVETAALALAVLHAVGWTRGR